jgi:signal transduction histidine kinase
VAQQRWKFDNPFSRLSWIIYILVILLSYAVIFYPTPLELLVFALLEFLVLTPLILAVGPKIFRRLYPDTSLYIKGITSADLEGLSLKQRVDLIESLLLLPKRRTLYSFVFTFIYKLIPEAVIIVGWWHYTHSPLLQAIKLIALIVLNSALVSSLVFIEGHKMVNKFIQEVHHDNDWSDVFKQLPWPTGLKKDFFFQEALAIVVTFVSTMMLVAILMLNCPQNSHFALSVSIVMLLAFTGLSRVWYLNRRYAYESFAVMVRTFENFNPAGSNKRLPVFSSPELTIFARTFNQLAERIEESERELSSYLAGQIERSRYQILGEVSGLLSHDLAAPLTSIRFCIESIIENPQKAAHPKYQENLKSSLDRALSLIHSLRSYLKDPQHSHGKATFRDTHNYVLNFLRYQFPEAAFDQIFTVDLSQEEAARELTLSRSNLILLLQSFYSSSLNDLFSHNVKEPEIEIFLATTADGQGLEITLRDNDPGSLPDNVAKAVERTPRQETLRRLTLGLRLSKRLVEKCGGKLEHDVVYRAGKCYRITLPLLQQ